MKKFLPIAVVSLSILASLGCGSKDADSGPSGAEKGPTATGAPPPMAPMGPKSTAGTQGPGTTGG